jgi:tetrahydromethanopterin S-methyltransferase subunit B
LILNNLIIIIIIQIATKLIAMQQSLKILTDVPDYADRVNRLETLKNRLEALMSPTVVAAFNTQDVGMNIYSFSS